MDPFYIRILNTKIFGHRKSKTKPNNIERNNASFRFSNQF